MTAHDATKPPFLAKLFPQLCSCNWNGNCDLFSDYERQKGHNFPIL